MPDPPASPAAGTLDNLPTIRSSLIGREQEIAAVRSLVLRETVGLVTLTGAGGVGKTRLAIEAAGDLKRSFKAGVVLVDLAPIADPALVAGAIATALGVQEAGNRTLTDLLVEYLRERSLLLLLDNVEHLLPAAPLVADLLSRCPDLKVLATGRAPLHLRDEHEIAVAPLTLPNVDALPPLGVLADTPAVALFVERAQAAKHDFALTEENAADVAAICVRLDGLPLAIELAAARIKLLPPRELSDELQRRLTLLADGPVDAPARQRSLHDTLAWSYGLLAGGEQRLFRWLGVFAGGWTLEAAGVVAALDEATVLDGLTSLVGMSLVQVNEDRAGEPRFRMLSTIREFALDQLDESETVEVRDIHARYFLQLATPAVRYVAETDYLTPPLLLEEENGNLRAALDWFVEQGNAEQGLRMAGALRSFWIAGGHLSEAGEWVARLLALPEADSAPPGARAEALRTLGGIARLRSDFARAVPLFEEGVALARAGGDSRQIGAAEMDVGGAYLLGGRIPEARPWFEMALLTARSKNDRALLADVFGLQAMAANIGGEVDRTAELAGEALTAARESGHRVAEARALRLLGESGVKRGDLDRSERWLAEALALYRELGNNRLLPQMLEVLGRLAFGRSDLSQAAAYQRESMALRLELGAWRYVAVSIRALAELAVAGNSPGRAARLLGAADAILEALGVPPTPGTHEQALIATREALGDVWFDAEYQAGRELNREQVVIEALSDAPALQAPDTVPALPAARASRPAGLSAREAEILQLLASGKGNREIAEILVISPNTVIHHVSSIFNKTGASNRVEATAFAIRNGLL